MDKLVIRDAEGNIISQSKNLRGIRQYVSKHEVKVVSIDEIANGEGKLCILFVNGSSFECNFASFRVLKQSILNWRNLYGYRIIINGNRAGLICHANNSLQ